MKINKKRIRWGRILLTFVAMLGVLGAAIGLLGDKLAVAWEGDYWTTEYDDLSITVVSLSQNGVSLSPQSDGEGGYYFVTENSTDTVTVGAIVDGMKQGESYYYHATPNWWNSRVDLTYEDNGSLIYQELRPNFYVQDDCYDCWVDPMSGLYTVGASVSMVNGTGVQKNLVLRPARVGSHSIEIVSVKQGDTNLAITNNEYQITNYNTPVTLTYKLKNLEIGKNYSYEVAHVDYHSFKAEATEMTLTSELPLNYTNKHLDTTVNLYSSDISEQVNLYFNIADENFRPLGDIIIDEIQQGGTPLLAVADTSGWQRTYTFTANDAQGLTVFLHSTGATASMNYYISYYMNGSGPSLSSDELVRVTGEELEMGAMITIPAAFGMSDSSPLTLSFAVNTTGVNRVDYMSQKLVYKNYAEYQNASDIFRFSIYEDATIPRYGASMYYSDGTEIDSNRISPAVHDATHPLLVEVKGERYDNARTYDVRAKVDIAYGGGNIYDHVFQVTGAELNEGTVLTLTGLTLVLPEFDPSGTTSGYELAYEFSLDIDGLQQSGEMIYVYEGWINPSITFNNGEVIAMGSGGGMGGDYYTTMNGVTARKTLFSGSRGAKINYLAGAFDDVLNYDYTIYYNDNAGDSWWSAPAGTIVASGTVTGEELNNNGFTVNIAAPSNESEGVLYTLVLSRGGKIVRIVRDSIVFTTEPMIESFKFTADSDSFMQTDRSSYRVATGTDAVATLTGDGFTNNTEYKLWVSYSGYSYSEEYDYPQRVDLSELDTSIVVTGAQLNAGYAYNLNYVEAFEGVNFVEVDFALTDGDAVSAPEYSYSNGTYSGHSIHIDYVNNDEVFRDNGYQVNEDGTITNVSQPDQPHGPDGPIPVDNRATGYATVTVEGGTLTVVSEKPVVIVGLRNGEWVKLFEWDVVVNGDERTNHYSVGDCSEVVVALKGNLKDDDTTINMLDATVIYRSLLSPDSDAYRALTPVEAILADLDGNQNINMLDATVIYRSLLSPDSPAYEEIQW
ncbi:hypothetical protein IKF12_00365 [Candidatus Saccharibacteria bacterium]|nr:hypothetical protein [Candidatus Saccharibacteria bacterium]